MPYHRRDASFPPMRESNEPQYPPLPGEGGDRGRQYHQRERSSSNSVTLPPISPYESYSQHPPHPQGFAPDQRGYPESYAAPPASTYAADYPRVNPQPNYGQSAPRQRTAIACRYCRRRKIRCSGFDQNPDGRCVNCQRFQQDCIFTPVSSQAQAFVPAHAVYPGMRNMSIGPDGRPQMLYPQGAPLYGAHGQPLPPPVVHQGAPYDLSAPSPTGSYSSYAGDERGAQVNPESSRGRLQHEPHHPTILPPLPGHYSRGDHGRSGNFDEDLRLPPVTPPALSPGGGQPSRSSYSIVRPGQQYLSHPPPGQAGESRIDPMRLGSIMENRFDHDIDRDMLGRLGRRG